MQTDILLFPRVKTNDLYYATGQSYKTKLPQTYGMQPSALKSVSQCVQRIDIKTAVRYWIMYMRNVHVPATKAKSRY